MTKQTYPQTFCLFTLGITIFDEPELSRVRNYEGTYLLNNITYVCLLLILANGEIRESSKVTSSRIPKLIVEGKLKVGWGRVRMGSRSPCGKFDILISDEFALVGFGFRGKAVCTADGISLPACYCLWIKQNIFLKLLLFLTME